MADTMLEAARGDLVAVTRLLLYPLTDDDATLGIIAFLLQQTVEKSLKSLLESAGIDYRALGHSIGKSLRTVDNHLPGVLSDSVTEELRLYTNILTDWESVGRYPSSFLFMVAELKKLFSLAVKLYNECADYFGAAHFDVQRAVGYSGVADTGATENKGLGKGIGDMDLSKS